MLACVTAGLTAPGVHTGSGNRPRMWQLAVPASGTVGAGGVVVAEADVAGGPPADVGTGAVVAGPADGVAVSGGMVSSDGVDTCVQAGAVAIASAAATASGRAATTGRV